jgi:FtsP/CotA-like multicopper oxidase with cupredoxin domain
MNRRVALGLGTAGLLLAGSGFARFAFGDRDGKYPDAPRAPLGANILDVSLKAKRRPRRLLPEPAGLTPVLGYGEADGPTVIRMRHGQWLRARLENALEEHTTIHWHGIRIPNAMDGVPYLTQDPVLPGKAFTYEFRPPNPGTFFFHPHCDTITQFGEGLVGALIVEGDETRAFDADLTCLYRDWRIETNGAFGALTTEKGAGTSGTFGRFQTVNDRPQPVMTVPANGDIRVRFLNLDMTRLIDLGIDGGRTWMIATDGNALQQPVPLDTWRMGPAMRLDIAFRAPAKAGARVRLMNYYAAQPIVLAEFEAAGAPLVRPDFVPVALKQPDLPEPKQEGALGSPLRLSAASAPSDLPPGLKLPDGSLLSAADSLCLTSHTFWAMNGQTWPSAAEGHLPAPLAQFSRGRSIVIEISNATPHPHPIHLHGHTFKVLASNKRTVLPHFADTALVGPNERLKIGFVADNPGDWMLHCHIIEHQETGMMGYVRVA